MLRHVRAALLALLREELEEGPRRVEPILPTALYSTHDVAEILGSSERRVRDLPLRFVPMGKGRGVLGEDLLAFLRSKRLKALGWSSVSRKSHIS